MMSRIVYFFDYANGSNTDPSREQGYLDIHPEACPVCHYSIETNWRLANRNNGSLEVVFNCTRRPCGALFIGYYSFNETDGRVGKWHLTNCLPCTPTTNSFQDEITSLSPSFGQIYNQAENAAAFGLGQVAGMGYRKALEFLIKDYLIDFKKEDRENIENKFLGNCIKDHIENQNIRVVAERATWLGNDESHYVRKWEDKDVGDLKKLIELVVYWISSEILTHKLVEEMP
jgi:hypothetical protein